MPKLTYTYEGEEHTVEVTDSCSIGRAETNTVPLAKEPGASRRHAQIMKLSKSFEMTDLGSTNGTKVNGKTVKRHRLEHGDRISIGETHLVWTEREDRGVELEEEISLDGGAAPATKTANKTGADCYLVFAGGDRDGERIALDKSRVTFGRKASNTMVFESSSVSGYHCEISREGGAYILRDLGSTNGTLLDGEPVTEVALQHGGRIRVGDRRLVFVDPSVSDFEKAMAAVDDLGSEWGMLRAEMDMSRVQKARRSQLVGVLGLFAILAAVGYVLLTKPELFSTPAVELENRDGNMIDDHSFEDLADGWAAVSGSPARGAFESDGAKQGSAAYSVARAGSGAPLAVVEFAGRTYSARPGQAYEFGAAAKASGGGRAAVRIQWLGAGEGVAARYASTTLVEGSSWTDVSAIAVAPKNTTGVRVQLVNAGEGKAEFDDIFLVTGSGRAATATDGAITISAGPSGRISISRGSDVLLDDVAVVGGLFATAADTGERAERGGGSAAAASVSSDGGVVVKGKVIDPATGEGGAYSVTVSAEGGRYVNIIAELPGGAGLEGIVAAGFMDEGIGFYTSSGTFRERASRTASGVQSATIGGLNLYEVSSVTPCRVAMTTDSGTAVAFGPAEGTALTLRIDTSSTEIVKARDQKYQDARTAEQTGRYGDAKKLYEEFASSLPEGDSKRVEAEKKAAQFAADLKQQLDSLRRALVGAKKFSEVPSLVSVQRVAEKLQDEYGDKGAEGIAKEAHDALKSLGAADASSKATPLLARAADFAKSKMNTLARLSYQDIVKRFEGTEAAKTAQEALRALGE